jgi:putative Mg2+ transporter-C (MgtC) family protein
LTLDFFFKCLLSLLIGAVIGMERESRHKPAGLKTHVLISLGSTVFTFLSIHFSTSGVADPGRIAAQVVSGIGFIGAGTILHSQRVVKGLTTAATLWMATALGMLVGADLVVPAIVGTIIVALFLFSSQLFIRGDSTQNHYSVTLEVKKVKSLEEIEDMIQKFGLFLEYKSLVKTDVMHLELNYSTTALTQHLFMKRLLKMKGLGEIVTI